MLQSAFMRHRYLEELDLSKCSLKCESVKPIAELIQSQSKIKSLNLSNNNISDLGARLLLTALQQNKFLTKFRIDLNPIRILINREIDLCLSQN